MKAIFFDIDGTIISDDGKSYIPQSTKETIKKLRENGCMTFINTGRVYCNVNPYIKELGFNGYLCGCGTNIIVDNQELLYNKLEKSRCIEIAKFIHNLGYEPLYERKDGIFFDNTNATQTHTLKFKKFFESEGKDVSRGIEHSDFSFDKFIVWVDDTPKRQHLEDFLHKDFDCILRSDSFGNFFEVVPKGFSKSTAIDVITQKFNISLDDVYAIGDGENDLPMFQSVKNSIAMKGNKDIYPYVSYVTDTIYNDGIQKAMQYFNLI